MQTPWTTPAKLWRSRSSPRAFVKQTPQHHHPSILLSRSYYQQFDWQALGPCEARERYRPSFSSQVNYIHGNLHHQHLDPTQRRLWRTKEDTWTSECLPRLRYSGIPQRSLKERKVQVETGIALNPDAPGWNHPYLVREGCRTALLQQTPVSVEIKARKLCASVEDARYPSIYRSLATQAHVLYVLGRLELERASEYRKFAFYMLCIAAGLGQLDAALLLHQLGKYDAKNAPFAEQRAIIAQAAKDRLDWRAMAAHCEHTISQAKGQSGRGKLREAQLVECVDMLTEAMALTRPTAEGATVRHTPPKDFIDVETLEAFDPPHKLLLELANDHIAAGDPPDEIMKQYNNAALIGALDYRDPNAAWQYVQWNQETEKPHRAEWVECAEIAARSANADACFQLAKHHLQRDKWIPSIAAKTLNEIEQQEHEARLQNRKDEDAEPQQQVSEQEKHERIMAQKDETLLKATEGLEWMKIAARLHVNSGGKMLNRYCIVAGLLRQNGFLTEGCQALLEAKEELKDCVGNPRETERAVRVLDEYIEHWDSRFVHQLLTPSDIGGLLDVSQRR